ncbi:MAG: iron ABC transporter permease [Acidimicrobiia bacterium]|nr:iron ABC transporter permease [Acidimicrobiia bacterium]
MAAGVGAMCGAALVGVLVGPAAMHPVDIMAELVDRLVPFTHVESGLSERQAAILWNLRVPRVVLGGMVGAMLAVAGASYQGAFRNPLADPYLLGVAAGAGLGATLAFAYVPGVTGLVPVAAFLGALLGVGIAYALGRSRDPRRAATSLILSGVAVASFMTALQIFVQQQHSDTLRQVYGWILGRLTTAGWSEVLQVLPYVAVSLAALLLAGHLLDVISVGDEEAETLGVNTKRVRLVIVGLASLGTAAAVAVSGLIGFVGIIVPHTIRLVAGSSYRSILPLSVLFGAAFLILTDLAARTVVSPAELPIGVVTALIGAPFFAVVLRSSGEGT